MGRSDQKKEFASWSGLIAKAVTKHFPESEETTKGHGCKTQSSLCSTKTTASDNMYSDNSNDNTAPKPHPPPCPTTKQHKVYIKIHDLKDKAQLKMYSNLTGQFLKKSSHGNQYIMVLIELDSNAILVQAVKNCMSGEMIHSYHTLEDRLYRAGIQPKMHLLDNKCSTEFKEQIKLN
jgi:hypothetical protein